MVQTWFESNCGKSKKISYPHPQTNTNSLGEDSTQNDFYFNEIFDITPIWTAAEISTYLSVNSIVLVPVKPITFLDASKQEYVFVCFRNEKNQIDGRLQVYQPTRAYKKTHLTYDVQDFTGFMLQIGLSGKVERVFGYENGQLKTRINPLPNTSLGSSNLNVRGNCPGCFTDDPTSSWWHDVGCWLCGIGIRASDTDGLNRNGNTGESNWNGVLGNTTLSLGNSTPTNYSPTGNSGNGGGNTSLSAQITNGFFNSRSVVIAKLLEVGYTNNELSDLSTPALKALLNIWAKYEGAGFSPAEYIALKADADLFAQVDGFLNQNGFTAENKETAKDFNFLMGLDDDFKSLNDNRGSKNIKQLLDEYSFPNLRIGTLIGLARDNGIDINHPDEKTKNYNYQRLGRVFEDFLLRSLIVPSNQITFNSPIAGYAGVKPDGLGNGNVAQYDENLRRENTWIGNNSLFVEVKLVFKDEKIIKDNVTTTVNYSTREQIFTMINVLANMRGGVLNGVNDLTLKPSDHGIASLYILTMYDTELDPTLVTQAADNNVNVYKRWPVYNRATGNVRVSDSYQDKTPFITSRKRPGYTDPIFSPKAVTIDWNIK